jgi:hypothetical protein
MRRSVTAPRLIAQAAALALMLTACSTGTDARRTVVVTQTFSSGGAATGSPVAGTGASVTIGQPSGSGATSARSASSAKTTARPATTAKATTKPSATAKPSTSVAPSTPVSSAIKKVNPLTVNCGSLLGPTDVQKITGSSIPAAGSRVKDVANPKVNSTGSIRCLYGITAGKQKLSLRITQYKTAESAAKQIGITVAAEKELGAQTSPARVGGQPAQILLREGGLINVQYGDWTLAIAVANGVMKGAQGPQLTKLAEIALARVLKNAA